LIQALTLTREKPALDGDLQAVQHNEYWLSLSFVTLQRLSAR
jgi:hypothetical protein